MKKQLSSLLLVITVVLGLCCQNTTIVTAIASEESAVYLKYGSNGNGTKSDPFGTLNNAIAALGDNDGTIYVIGEYDLKNEFSCSWNGMVTIKGVDDSSVLTIPESSGIRFNGDITFNDINIKPGLYSHLNPFDNKLIMDCGNSSVFNSIVHLTTMGNTNVNGGYAEFRSGTINNVNVGGAYCTDSSTTCFGDTTVIVDGATIGTLNISGDKYQTSHIGINVTGNVNVIVNSGKINSISYASVTAPKIDGALNFIFNNDTEIPSNFSYPDTAQGGVYIITSSVGGSISPTDDSGVFVLKPDIGKCAVINGQKAESNTVTLEPGEIDVTWEDNFVSFNGAQIRTTGIQGLRFIFSIPQSIAETSIEYGSVVMPKKYLGDSPLEIGTITTVNDKTYEAKKVPAKNIFNIENGYIYYTACITNIAEINYCSEYVAVPYVIYQDSNGETVTKYGEQTEKINVYTIASEAYKDESCDESVKNYLNNKILSLISFDNFMVTGTSTKRFGNVIFPTSTNNNSFVVGNRYDSDGNLIKENEVLYLDDLALIGDADDYFLSDITISSYKGKIISAVSNLYTETVDSSKVLINRAKQTDASYYVGANKLNEKVVTGSITFGKIDAYLDSSVIPSNSKCKNSVRFFELTGKNGDVYTYSPVELSFDGLYGFDSTTGAYDKLNNYFADTLPTVYSNGFYEAEVYDCNGDGYADLVFIKNERLLKLIESEGNCSGVLTSDEGYDYVNIGDALVKGVDFKSGDFVLAYENTDAKYIEVNEVILPNVYEITDITSENISFDCISDIALKDTIKYAFDKSYSSKNLDVGKLYTVYIKDNVLLYAAENNGYNRYVLNGTSAENYIKALYEQSNFLSPDAIRKGVDAISEQMKQDILNTPNTKEIYGDKITGTVYYISEKNGKDTNDGKSPTTAFKTINGYSSKVSLKAGDAVLFERGGVYRGRLSTAKDGIIFGSYGEGPKPLIMQSAKNYADESLWVETEWDNVWRCTTQLTNAGVIGFDHDIFDYSSATYDELYGQIMNVNILGFTGVADLNSDLQFYSDLSNGVAGLGDLYLYSEYGNPGKRFASIEIGENLAIMSGAGDNVIIDNLAFKFTGGHGMGGAGGCTNRTVTNCVYSWLGGSVLSLDFRGNGNPINYGNAIEIYGSCDGYVVQNCWMYQIYDTGVTHQYSETSKCIQKGVRYLENLIEFCHWGIEFYNANDNGSLPADQKYTSDVISRYNVVNRSGYGWGSIVRNRTTGSHSYCGSSLSTNYDWYTEYNIFNLSAGNIITLPNNSNEIPDRNIYIQYTGNKLGNLKGQSVNCDKSMKENLIKYYGDKHPVVIIADPNENIEDTNEREIEITLTYGSKTSSYVLYAEDSIIIPNLPEDAVIPDGMIFSGWADSLSEKIYAPGTHYSVTDTKVSLTAVFSLAGELNFIYGNKSYTEKHNIGDVITAPKLPSDATIPDGKVFYGWNTGNKTYFEGTSIVVTSNMRNVEAVFVDRGTECLSKRILRPANLSGFENPYDSVLNYSIKGVEIKQETFGGFDVKSYKKVADKITAERTKDGTLETTSNYHLNLYYFDAVVDSDSSKIRPFDAKYITVEYYYDTSSRDTSDNNGQDLTGKKMYYHQLYILANGSKTAVNWKANSTEGIVANKWHKVIIPLESSTGGNTYFDDTTGAYQLHQYKLYPFGNSQGLQMYKGDVFYIKSVTYTSYDPNNAPNTSRTVKFYKSLSEYENDGSHTSMTGLKDGDTFTIPAQANQSFFQRFKYWVRVGYDTQHTSNEKFTLNDLDDAIFYAVYGWF